MSNRIFYLAITLGKVGMKGRRRPGVSLKTPVFWATKMSQVLLKKIQRHDAFTDTQKISEKG